IFEEYTAKGLRILVTTSTHDYRQKIPDAFSAEDLHGAMSFGYDKNYEFKRFIKCVTREELRGMYAPYGRANAVSVHDFSMSYTYDLDDDHRLLAINDDYMTNPEKNHRRGFSKDQYEWIFGQINKAKEDGKKLVAVTHHPLLTPSPIYMLIGKNDMLDSNLNVAQAFADAGLNVSFTGHSHIHDIEYLTTKNGNLLYDISTSALVGYPPAMRKVEYREDGKVDVKTIVIQNLSRFDLQGKSLPEYCKESFFGMVKSMIGAMSKDFRTFAIYANSISIRYWTTYQFWWIFKAFGKFVNSLTLGKVHKICKKESGVTQKEIAPIKDKKVVPIIVGFVEKLFAGNADIKPDSTEFKTIMGTVAILDDIVRALGVNLKGLLGYDRLKDVVEPLVYNNGIDDYDALIDPLNAPEAKPSLPEFKSNKGAAIIIGLILAVLFTLPILLPTGIVLGVLIALRGTKLFNPYKGKNRKILPPTVD
ncbi:MAG: metallophosphoesterase, partial [Clostridia bacterium]|nr:metallophosphoesterase [Clostridia bacterium]